MNRKIKGVKLKRDPGYGRERGKLGGVIIIYEVNMFKALICIYRNVIMKYAVLYN